MFYAHSKKRIRLKLLSNTGRTSGSFIVFRISEDSSQKKYLHAYFSHAIFSYQPLASDYYAW